MSYTQQLSACSTSAEVLSLLRDEYGSDREVCAWAEALTKTAEAENPAICRHLSPSSSWTSWKIGLDSLASMGKKGAYRANAVFLSRAVMRMRTYVASKIEANRVLPTTLRSLSSCLSLSCILQHVVVPAETEGESVLEIALHLAQLIAKKAMAGSLHLPAVHHLEVFRLAWSIWHLSHTSTELCALAMDVVIACMEGRGSAPSLSWGIAVCIGSDPLPAWVTSKSEHNNLEMKIAQSACSRMACIHSHAGDQARWKKVAVGGGEQQRLHLRGALFKWVESLLQRFDEENGGDINRRVEGDVVTEWVQWISSMEPARGHHLISTLVAQAVIGQKWARKRALAIFFATVMSPSLMMRREDDSAEGEGDVMEACERGLLRLSGCCTVLDTADLGYASTKLLDVVKVNDLPTSVLTHALRCAAEVMTALKRRAARRAIAGIDNVVELKAGKASVLKLAGKVDAQALAMSIEAMDSLLVLCIHPPRPPILPRPPVSSGEGRAKARPRPRPRPSPIAIAAERNDDNDASRPSTAPLSLPSPPPSVAHRGRQSPSTNLRTFRRPLSEGDYPAHAREV
mmetsp:Transcript_23819/g.60144  ORF Transcript_23819/g.60144 Transcript_23819/m.60144 type:complete len:571 (-) Transcript_23819:979-2691(-)